MVAENIRNSFPEKSEDEVHKITRAFFQHLCDLIFESIKGCSISKKETLKRHRYTNIELLNKYYEQGKQITILGAHVGNWEWVALSLPLVTPFQTYGIFQTINNPFMNRVMKQSRERHGMKLINKKEVADTLKQTKGQRITMGYIGDQSPARTGRNHWMKFLNQDTAVTTGFEHFAKQYDTPVLYLNITKKKRGYYEGSFHLIADDPKLASDNQIIETFMHTLEKVIQQHPAHWLWSHRRWKLKKPYDTTQNHSQRELS